MCREAPICREIEKDYGLHTAQKREQTDNEPLKKIDYKRGSAKGWDSGRVDSSGSIMIPYQGAELSSRSLCYWRVRVWSEKGEVSPWSEIARFGVGIVGKELMQGNYIGLSPEAGNTHTPLLRKTFTIAQKSTSFLHVNSLGYHEVYINGQRVSDDVLSPAVSQLNKRSLIVTYDVTQYLRKGKNELVIWLGTGWYKKTGFDAGHDGALVRAQLDCLQNKKWETIVVTDSSWQGHESGYRDTGTWQALNFGGERVDAKLNPKDLSWATLDALSWSDVVEVQIPNLIATPEMTEPNKIQKTFVAQSIVQIDQSSWLVDMGKNLNGWFEMRFEKLPAGHQIIFEYTDYIDKQGTFHDQGQSDIYIASGEVGEVFRNRFNHHAFRHVKIKNLPYKPQKEEIKAYLIHTNYQRASTFECSDSDLNKIHNMIQYTMTCLAFGGYMVDCPHLERAGYGGDGNSSTETFQTMYDVAPLYTNWTMAWNDAMREGGSLPHVAPNPGAGGGGPYWCGFIIMAPWQTYLNYGDRRLLERGYPAMKQWLDYVEKYTIDGLLTRWPDTPYRDWFLGDWLAPMGVDAGAGSSVSLVSNCFVSDCLAKMEKIATILGQPDQAKQYALRRENLNKLLHNTYYNAAKGVYSTGSQLDMTYPMLVGVTPESEYAKVRNQLMSETTNKYNDHIAVGLVGVPILTKWAIQNKEVDFMYSMLKKQDYPGYLNMINNGATTTWEYWSGERSRIHNCYNGIGMWFYQAVGGICVDENQPGYKHVLIEPQIPKGLTWAKTTKESPYGTIAVDWSLESGELKVDITLPVGCTATVILPMGTKGYTLNGEYIPI